MTVTQGLFVVVWGNLSHVLGMPLAKILAILVNYAALGAIAGSIGAVVSRGRHRSEVKADPVQYSLSELLVFASLFAVLFSSLAILCR